MSIWSQKWLILIALVPAVALAFLDQAILPVALPTIHFELGGTATQLQWCVNAYVLAICVFVLVCGKLSDKLGPKNILNYGMSLFALASCTCAISPTIELLIIGRGLQGVGVAMMSSAQNVLIAVTILPTQRGKATGFIVSIGSIFMILGPLIGGYLTEALSWRWIFWINLPISMIGLWLIHKYLPKIKPSHRKIDGISFLLFALGASSLTIYCMQVAQWGFISLQGLACVSFSAINLFLLSKREQKSSHPFLDLSLFKRPLYALAVMSISITQFTLMITVFQTIYFQEVLQFTPIETGWLSFASCLPVFFIPLIAGALSDHFSPKLPLFLGFTLLICSLAWLGFFSTPPFQSLAVALFLFGMGITFIFTPSYSAAMSSVSVHKLGIAFGMLLTLRMFAGTIGLSLMHLFISQVQKSWISTVEIKGAEIKSFSQVHLALAFVLSVALLLILYFHPKATLQSGHFQKKDRI